MLRTTSLLAVTAAFALSASVAGACPFSKNQQTTQAPMSPIASADAQSAIATHDGASKPAAPATQPKQQ